MATISLTLSPEQIENLVKTFADSLQSKLPPYAKYCIRYDDCIITIYHSNKVLFQGKNAELYAASFTNKPKQETQQINTNSFPQCGSDEVGTGDYFGPVVVCACLLTQPLNEFELTDSKILTDEYILRTVPNILPKVTYSICILHNEKYNQVHLTNNLNMIKAKLHNQCYINLEKKAKQLPALKVVDQFTPEKNYYNYLAQESRIIKGIYFTTKAESKFTSVGCASMIARYTFLKEMEKLEEQYQTKIPKGAGEIVNKAIEEFINKYSWSELNKVAKLHFANTTIVHERIDHES